MDGSDQFTRKGTILDLVSKSMDNDVAGDLVHDQQGHVIGGKIVGSEAVHTTFGVGDTCPHGEIDDGGNQPVHEIHQQIGAVLPLFCPVHLPESSKYF